MNESSNKIKQAFNDKMLRWEIFGEKCISFAQLVLLGLHIFWGKCVYFSILKWQNSQSCQKKRHNCEFYHSKIEKLMLFPQKICKLSKTNIFFSRFEGTGCHKEQFINLTFCVITNWQLFPSKWPWVKKGSFSVTLIERTDQYLFL